MTAPLHDCVAMNAVYVLRRPRIEPARDCQGFYVLRGSHGWLCGEREQASREFAALERIEREGRA
jgi:hypothetical protein